MLKREVRGVTEAVVLDDTVLASPDARRLSAREASSSRSSPSKPRWMRKGVSLPSIASFPRRREPSATSTGIAP